MYKIDIDLHINFASDSYLKPIKESIIMDTWQCNSHMRELIVMLLKLTQTLWCIVHKCDETHNFQQSR